MAPVTALKPTGKRPFRSIPQMTRSALDPEQEVLDIAEEIAALIETTDVRGDQHKSQMADGNSERQQAGCLRKHFDIVFIDLHRSSKLRCPFYWSSGRAAGPPEIGICYQSPGHSESLPSK